MNRWGWLLAVLVAFAGCDDAESEGDGAGGGAGGGNGGVDADAGPGGGAGGGAGGGLGGSAGGGLGGGAGGGAEEVGAVPRSGTWRLSVELPEFGGFVLPLQLELDAEAAPGGGGMMRSLSLRAVARDDSVSEPLATLSDVAVSPDGAFEAAFVEVTLPGAYTITGSDLLVSVTLAAQVPRDDFFCGTVTGEVHTLSTPIAAATFAAVPWDQAGPTPPTSCAGDGGGDDLPRLAPEACPALGPGENAGFPSGGHQRSARIFLPADHTPDRAWPLVFLWHGLGGDQDGILDATRMADFVDAHGFILIVPASRALPVEWDQVAAGDNPDLAFFDDLLTCAHRAFNVDPDRVHTTGLSAGGLWSGFLTLSRPEVLASSALFSGGVLADFPAGTGEPPVLVAWGGPDDVAHTQNFDTFARTFLDRLQRDRHFFVACDHGMGHAWEADFTPWALKFLLDHPRGVSPEPYSAGLPAEFPGYCGLTIP